MTEQATAVLILGMHRSGTSALTRVLNLCGVDLGSRLMPPAEGNNERGFWEHMDAVRIHETALTHLGRSWSDTRRLPADWRDSAAAATATDNIEALARGEFGASRLWAVKDPRACRFVPLWIDALARAGVRLKLLFVLRHPDEVSASLARRDGMSAAETGLLQLNHFFDAALASVGQARCAVTYQSLLDDWRGCMQRIAGELDIELPALEQAAGQIEQFLDRDARTHHAPDDDMALRESLNGRVYLLARDSATAAQFWDGVTALGDSWDLYRNDLLPYVDELADMLQAREALERPGNLPAAGGSALAPLARLQFRMIAGLQDGVGKLGQASADLGAMVRIGSENALGASGDIAGRVAELRSVLGGVQESLQGLGEACWTQVAAAGRHQQQLGDVLVQADVLRRHVDDVAALSGNQMAEFAARHEQRLLQLAQQADAQGGAREQRLAERLEAATQRLEQHLLAQAAREEARWPRRLRRWLTGK
jgi:hypothetical protein